MAVAARLPEHQMFLAIHWRDGITYDPIFSTGDWVSHNKGSSSYFFRATLIHTMMLDLVTVLAMPVPSNPVLFLLWEKTEAAFFLHTDLPWILKQKKFELLF